MNLYLCDQNGLHMYQHKYVFAQLMAFLDRNHFNYLVRKYDGDKYVKHFSCWNQLLTLMFGQLSNRESLRDLILATEAHHQKCYHLGLGKHVTRSNLSKANSNRDYRIFEEYAYYLVSEARRKRVTDIFKLDGSQKAYPEPLRLVRLLDDEQGREFMFLTNATELTAQQIAGLYKNRWQIELFFKWLKQHLKIKKFWGTTENAVRIQIYSAIIAYSLVAIVQHDMVSERSTYEVLQIPSMSLTDTTPLIDLFDKTIFKKGKERSGSSEPNLFNF